MLNQTYIKKLHELCKTTPELAETLEELSKEIDQELSRLNQLMRTELSIVAGSSKLLAQQNPTLSKQELWHTLYHNFKHLSSYVEEYEAYRIRMHFTPDYVDLITLCEKIASTFQSTAHAQHISFAFHNETKHPETFRSFFCDAEQLTEAILGPLRHAFQSIPDVTYVNLYLREDGPGDGIIHIERDGASISEEDLEMLQTGHFSRELYHKHVGILTSQRFILNCQGKFEISSTPEQTYITMHLFRQKPEKKFASFPD